MVAYFFKKTKLNKRNCFNILLTNWELWVFTLDNKAYACYNIDMPSCGLIFANLRKREAERTMKVKKRLKINLVRVVFGWFFAFIAMLGLVAPMFTSDSAVAIDRGWESADSVLLAIEPEGNSINNTNSDSSQNTANNQNTESGQNNEASQNTENSNNSQVDGESQDNGNETKKDGCKDSLGAIGWLVCPVTGKLAEAVDALYGKIEDFLVVEPISVKDGSPVYEIWKYCLTVTNIVFIIFLLVVIYSQITGLGISNYGVKKALPKLIVMAVLVNMSFLICSLAVDLSNTIGNATKGLFDGIEQVAAESSTANISMGKAYSSVVGGTALAVGAGVVLFDPATIWMLIPVALGAIVAVAIGLFMLALRQAVVVLLIMIAPLAFVAYILPNTEHLFKKWKQLFIRMLTFYPLFALLFGASSLAGFAIMMSAKTGFGILLGIAVQIFPLFFAVSLMKMSGTFLGGIYSRMHGFASRPLSSSRAWADSRRRLSQENNLNRNRIPSARLMNFMAYRSAKREADIDEMSKHRQSRYMAGHVLSKYDKNGKLSKKGQQEYKRQALSMRYAQILEMHKDNMNSGFSGQSNEYRGTIAEMKRDFSGSRGNYSSAIRGRNYAERVRNLDHANVNASDDLKFEMARGAKIEYENAKGFFERVSNARYARDDQNAIDTNNRRHKMHGVLNDPDNLERFNRMEKIMDGKLVDTHFVLGDAASTYNAQAQLVRKKMETYMDLTPATQDVINHLSEITGSPESSEYIDSIIGGLRVLNMRGDTDEVAKRTIHDLVGSMTNKGKIELGTYASQSLSKFVMFEVKDNDPLLRRFGKYINLETAAMFNEGVENKRTRKDVTWYEYINGEYVDCDESGNVLYEPDGTVKMRKSKRSAAELLKGTSFKGIERTAFASMAEGIREGSVSIGPDGEVRFDYEKYKKNSKAIWDAIMPNIIGDQFSYLSGSEQINALSKAITGVNLKNHKFDWEGIFGEENANNLTMEQKKDYIDFMHKRTKQFLGGHVPVQIAKSKSDMLEAIRAQYALLAAIEEDPSFLDRLENPENKFGDTANDTLGNYKDFEDDHMDEVRRMFVGSFKEDALKGFVKMHQKGYQGEAKDGLIKLLNPDELYRQYFPNGERRDNRRSNNQDDDEEGMPVGSDGGVGVEGGSIYNQARVDTESIYREYHGDRQNDVEDYWNRVKDVIRSHYSPEMGDMTVLIDDIEDAMPQFTNVSQLHEYIMRRVFGDR